MPILRARCLLPISGEPIEDGAVVVLDGMIAAVGRWSDLRTATAGEVEDLGDVILLPGLVNAHCHLDYTGMEGQIDPPKLFSDWIKAMLALKAGWGYADYALSWLQGARMSVAHGITTVADIESVPELLPEVWSATPLRVHSFLEMTSVRARRSAGDILAEAARDIHRLRKSGGPLGLSPHAPYSTSGELLLLAGERARQNHWSVATHLAESREEFDMFAHRRGPLFDWLKSQRSMEDCGDGSPARHLERHGLLGPNLLAIHVNYLAPGDAELLGARGVHVVHCPRSHAYFRHEAFPAFELGEQGVNLCLGTDSLATVSRSGRKKAQLNLFAEMAAFRSHASAVPPAQILQMATVNGAKALGLAGSVGELTAGAFADLIALPYSGSLNSAEESVIHHSGEAAKVMIGGDWVFHSAA